MGFYAAVTIVLCVSIVSYTVEVAFKAWCESRKPVSSPGRGAGEEKPTS